MATTSTQLAPARTAAHGQAAGRVSFLGAVRSEFTKIRSVRSTYWTLGALVFFMVAVAALAGGGAAHAAGHSPGSVHIGDPARLSLFGLVFGQLIIAVAGALTITSEFGTGMIRTSLSVLPQRGIFVGAKALVFATVAFVTSMVACFAAFFLGQALLSGQHLGTSLSSPDVLRQVIGGALFLTVCGMLAFGLGLLIRHTAGAISAAVGLLFVLFVLYSLVSGSLPVSWQNDIQRWIPFNAGSQIWITGAHVGGGGLGGPHMFAPWNGLAVFAGYAVIALVAGMVTFRRRNI